MTWEKYIYLGCDKTSRRVPQIVVTSQPQSTEAAVKEASKYTRFNAFDPETLSRRVVTTATSTTPPHWEPKLRLELDVNGSPCQRPPPLLSSAAVWRARYRNFKFE